MAGNYENGWADERGEDEITRGTLWAAVGGQQEAYDTELTSALWLTTLPLVKRLIELQVTARGLQTPVLLGVVRSRREHSRLMLIASRCSSPFCVLTCVGTHLLCQSPKG